MNWRRAWLPVCVALLVSPRCTLLAQQPQQVLEYTEVEFRSESVGRTLRYNVVVPQSYQTTTDR
jgi:hypothetical protein